MQLTTGYNGPGLVPFWIRSNQFGLIPPEGFSTGLTGGIHKPYNNIHQKSAAWSFGFEGRLNAARKSGFILTEGYVKARTGILEIHAGRLKQITGLCDTILSTGSWSVSGNAPGIPQIGISVPEFTNLPFFKGLIALKGSYVHGWLGKWYLYGKTIPGTHAYLHQKTLYGRIGRTGWRLKLYGGINHQVIWGNEKQIMGNNYSLSAFETFLRVNSSIPYDNDSIAPTEIGNHVGSIDIGFTLDFNRVRWLIYRQNLIEGGALFYLANVMDGLNGICVINKKHQSRPVHWNRLLLEFLYTKNQAGEKWSRKTPAVNEDYYNNGYYPAGWSYRGNGLGNPFINISGTLKEGFPKGPDDYFVNNRVAVIHIGMDVMIYSWNIISKMSYSRNYGTYHTSATGKPYEGSVYPSPYGVFPETGQFSFYLSGMRDLAKNTCIGLIIAADTGDLFDDTYGLMATITKNF